MGYIATYCLPTTTPSVFYLLYGDGMIYWGRRAIK